jgi:hypothetical protein
MEQLAVILNDHSTYSGVQGARVAPIPCVVGDELDHAVIKAAQEGKGVSIGELVELWEKVHGPIASA